jgi:Pyruvate/2-oxoacid:ferredoxin oxidoreductase delta subunit
MPKPNQLPTSNCSSCWKYFPVEMLTVRISNSKRKMRYCPDCLEKREKALKAFGERKK